MHASQWVIGFDADDTLWHNETIFETVHARYRQLLAQYHDTKTVDETLFATEVRNLELYGYGVKGFTLSAIETAIALTDGRITAQEIRELIELGRGMLAHPVELLEGVAETVATLARDFSLMLITKGDLRDQERKLARSGLQPHFSRVEIVSEKDASAYAAVFQRHRVQPENFLMVGNSLKSDILPVLALGGAAAYVPYHLTWQHERTEPPPASTNRFFTLSSIRELTTLAPRLAGLPR